MEGKNRYSGKIILTILFCVVFALSAWNYQNTIPQGPYQLIYPANFGNRIDVPDDNPTTQQGVYLGRMLFYETRLSATNKLSCASCHKQEMAFSDDQDFSLGVDFVPTTRNSMSLANLLWTRRFFWDGRVTGLEEQATVPLTNPHEMGQSLALSAQKLSSDKDYPELFKQVYGDKMINGDRIIKAIAQFERTLISANSRYDQYLRKAYQPTPDELRGMELFDRSPHPEKGIRGANCGRCHGGPKTYNELFHNNGLDSITMDNGIQDISGLVTDKGRFKAPTLRNIALTAPYMHDGRFKTLQQVIDHYSDHVQESATLSTFIRGESNEMGGKTLKLLPQEKRQIIAFLNMLTDSTFITDPRFSNPHHTIPINKHL